LAGCVASRKPDRPGLSLLGFDSKDRPLRQIGTLPKNLDPKVFNDYLISLGMKTRLDEQPEGWSLWIYNEDHVPQAREELRDYLDRPDDPRFGEAAEAALAVRRKEQLLDKQFRKNFRDATDLWAAPGFRRRPLTSILIAVCVVIFLLQNTWGVSFENRLYFASIEVRDGHLQSHGLDDIRQGEFWRLVTPVFMHGGIVHILFNMWWLAYLGTMIEIRRGTIRLAGLVLISAVLSNFGQYLYMERFEPGQLPLFLGFSGVVYALFGYIWMKMVHEPEQRLMIHPNNITIMMVWLFLCMTDFMSSVIGPVGNAAHIVGLIVGITFGLFRY
jgi:GlpG protein